MSTSDLIRAYVERQSNPTGRKDLERGNIKLLAEEPKAFTRSIHADVHWPEGFDRLTPEQAEDRIFQPVWTNIIGKAKHDVTFPDSVLGYTDTMRTEDAEKYRVITLYAKGEPLPVLPEVPYPQTA